MQLKFYGMTDEAAKRLEGYCRKAKINMSMVYNDEGLLNNVTITSIENQCCIASIFEHESIMITSFAEMSYPSLVIDSCDFEMLTII